MKTQIRNVSTPPQAHRIFPSSIFCALAICLLAPGTSTWAGWDLEVTDLRVHRHVIVDGVGKRIQSTAFYTGDQVEIECLYRYAGTSTTGSWKEWKAFLELHDFNWVSPGGDPPKVSGESNRVQVFVQSFSVAKLPYGKLSLSCELNRPVSLKEDSLVNNSMTVEVYYKPNADGLKTEAPAAATVRQVPSGQLARAPLGPKQPPASMPQTSKRIVTGEIVFIGAGATGVVTPPANSRSNPPAPEDRAP